MRPSAPVAVFAQLVAFLPASASALAGSPPADPNVPLTALEAEVDRWVEARNG